MVKGGGGWSGREAKWVCSGEMRVSRRVSVWTVVYWDGSGWVGEDEDCEVAKVKSEMEMVGQGRGKGGRE